MSTPDTFRYRFDPAAAASSDLTLLLLHGTGGDEDSLVPLGQALAPGAAVISARGNVSEQGAPRFFRRHAEGVLDQVDLAARTDELADWLPVVAAAHGVDPAGLVAVGFSNGANIAASVLFRRPEALRAAVLLSPSRPQGGRRVHRGRATGSPGADRPGRSAGRALPGGWRRRDRPLGGWRTPDHDGGGRGGPDLAGRPDPHRALVITSATRGHE
jgi:predicted esterase